MNARSPARFVRELKRRRVFRVAAVYAVVAWVVIEVASVVFPELAMPDWSVRLVILLAVFGFPVALVLAWAFDVTPDGVKRTAEASPGPNRPDTARDGTNRARLAAVFGAGMVVALVGFGAYSFLGGPTHSEEVATGSAPDARSIAVLPFENLSANEDNAYFAAGVHEEVLTQLSKVGELRVISRASVLPYAEAGAKLGAVGLELGVGAVVQGSVQRVGDEVRVTTQLIDATTHEQLWAERYDRRVEDVFAIQSEIALAIAEALHAEMAPGERERIEDRPTENMAAYDLYLRGHQLSHGGRDGNETAIELFKQAIALDPEFAPAHAAIASSYMERAQRYGFPIEWADSGVEAARRAIELDPELAAGYNILGLNLQQLGRMAEAREAFERAIELNPSSGSAMSTLSANAFRLGRYDESIRWATRALPLSPTSPLPPVEIAVSHLLLGNFSQAERWLDRTEALGPDFHFLHIARVQADLIAGRDDAAFERAQQALDRAPGDFANRVVAAVAALRTGRYATAAEHYERLVDAVPDGRLLGSIRSFRAGLAFALSKTGDPARADTLFDAAIEQSLSAIDRGDQEPWRPLEIAAIHAARGEREDAYHWLDRAFDAGARELFLIERDPLFEPLRGEPRFERFLERIRAELAAMRARVPDQAPEP